MSQNDHTGFESYSNDELVSEAYRSFEPLVHPPLLMELAKRLEFEGDASKQLAEIETQLPGDMEVADLLKVADAVIDHVNTTINLLGVLSKHGIESSETLDLILEAVSKIQEAA